MSTERFFLLRLIPDGMWLHSEDMLTEIYDRQKSSVARHLMDKLDDGQMIVVCDTVAHCQSLCPNVYCRADATTHVNLQLFNRQQISQLAVCDLTDIDWSICKYVVYATVKQTVVDKDVMSLFGQNDHLSVFVPFHIGCDDEKILGKAIAGMPSSLFSLQILPVANETDQRQDSTSSDYDRIKKIRIPADNDDVEYQFMWNDGFKGVYYTIYKNGRKDSGGYLGNVKLVRCLNTEFDSQQPSKRLITTMREAFQESRV